jgi:hypothetical protein
MAHSSGCHARTVSADIATIRASTLICFSPHPPAGEIGWSPGSSPLPTAGEDDRRAGEGFLNSIIASNTKPRAAPTASCDTMSSTVATITAMVSTPLRRGMRCMRELISSARHSPRPRAGERPLRGPLGIQPSAVELRGEGTQRAASGDARLQDAQRDISGPCRVDRLRRESPQCGHLDWLN